MNCRHCECEATEDDADEGSEFKCMTCGILGTVVLGDRDVDHGEDGGVYAVAYLYFEPNEVELCTLDDCVECWSKR